MKTYLIPMTWHMYGEAEIEAENLAEAIKKAEEGYLPEGEYIAQSAEVDLMAIAEEYPDEDFLE